MSVSSLKHHKGERARPRARPRGVARPPHLTVRPRALLAEALKMLRQVAPIASAPSAGARAGCTHIADAVGCHTAAIASASPLSNAR
eukprot:3898919-Pyramimonas_sp.AAC.1